MPTHCAIVRGGFFRRQSQESAGRGQREGNVAYPSHGSRAVDTQASTEMPVHAVDLGCGWRRCRMSAHGHCWCRSRKPSASGYSRTRSTRRLRRGANDSCAMCNRLRPTRWSGGLGDGEACRPKAFRSIEKSDCTAERICRSLPPSGPLGGSDRT